MKHISIESACSCVTNKLNIYLLRVLAHVLLIDETYIYLEMLVHVLLINETYIY